MIKAEICESARQKGRNAVLPEKKEILCKEIDSMYERDRSVVIKLDPQDEAFVKMVVTYEGDLPGAYFRSFRSRPPRARLGASREPG